tara:strand:+ start:34477 stop:35172 length:696 start_codon:yes stop_codon:yes gene_type:complete
VSLPSSILRIEPHPYFSLNAPYGKGEDPWRLRVDVVKRLLLAQEYLRKQEESLCLAIFDAWRPIAVQAFMVDYSIDKECISRGINKLDKTNKKVLQDIKDEVSKFWAPPSLNPSTPPPHSTGAAVDLTLATSDGSYLNMGGDIDAVSDISKPDYYSDHAQDDYELCSFNNRRILLSKVMSHAGFIQHPNEWWHYSYGDQLWAWKSNNPKAIYGAWDEKRSSFTKVSPNTSI